MKLSPRSSSPLSRPVRSISVLALVAALAACASPPDSPSRVTQAVTDAVAQVRTDADMQQVLDAHAALGPKPIESLSVAEARQQPTFADAVNAVLRQQGRSTDPASLVPGVTARDTTIGANSLPVRIYTPEGRGPFPVIVYYHGGGWVIADKAVYDGGARGLAKQANAVVVSVDYRRAPEARFPAAWDDALSAYRWVAQNASRINGDPQRLALAGESAGGNLAVATAIAARDAGLTQPRHVVAVYPVAQTGSLNTPSYIENQAAKPLNRPMIEWFMGNLLRSEADKADPRLDLISANLQGLPATTIINARIDPLRSDGSMLEEALRNAGVPVERQDYTGVTHEFFGGAAVIKKAEEAQMYAGQRLRQSFGN